MPRLLALCALAALLLPACDATRDTPSAGMAGAAETIDSVRVRLTTVGVVPAQTASFTVTGLATGPLATSTDSVVVDTSRTYTGQITFADDVLAEIRAEAESHLVTFAPTGDVTVTPTDRESQFASQNLNDGDYPLGLSFSFTTTAQEGTFPLTVRLGHFDGAAKTSGTDTGGTADLTFTIPIVVSSE